MRGMRGSIFSWGPWLSIVLTITFLLSCGSEDPVSPEPPDPPEPVDQPVLKIGLLIDNDFLFGTPLSDRDQGPVLAKVTQELGYGDVGMIYRDDVWGRGIANAIENAWDGQLIRVAVDPNKTTLVEERRESKGVLEDTQALIVLAFRPQQEIIVREALDNVFYDVFIFGPTGRSLDLIRSIGPEHLAGMIGTSPGSAQDTPTAIAWEDGYKSAYGGNPPPFPYVKQTYDATAALALRSAKKGIAHARNPL